MPCAYKYCLQGKISCVGKVPDLLVDMYMYEQKLQQGKENVPSTYEVIGGQLRTEIKLYFPSLAELSFTVGQKTLSITPLLNDFRLFLIYTPAWCRMWFAKWRKQSSNL